MRDITKSFQGNLVLQDVQLAVRRGEVHALLGENGAGKSTLMKILSGIYRPDGGEIRFDGKVVNIDSPTTALGLGISTIYQELNPVPDLTVAENIFLGREPTDRFLRFTINNKNLHESSSELLRKFGMDINPRTKMYDLSLAQKQMIEIIKAVSYNAKLIIMDEPTSSLSQEEVQTLFRTVQNLKASGVSVIFISHRMDEVFNLCQRVTVLRDGQFMSSDGIENCTTDKLISMMVGRSLTNMYPRVQNRNIGGPVLEIRQLSANGKFHDVNFTLHKGEILGFYGLVGAGRTEVMRAIFGIDRYDTGSIVIEGKPLRRRNPAKSIEMGIGMVTEDRKELGLVLCRPIRENMTLSVLGRQGFLLRLQQEYDNCIDMARVVSVKMRDLKENVELLSGGNQQKVVLAKWLLTRPKVLILDEPTRGIDVGAKSEIYKLIVELSQAGTAVLVVSSELPEILGLCDRVMVMSEGQVQGEFLHGEMTEEGLLQSALRGRRNGTSE